MNSLKYGKLLYVKHYFSFHLTSMEQNKKEIGREKIRSYKCLGIYKLYNFRTERVLNNL